MGKTADYGLGDFTFPRGWFMVCAADELTDRPLPVRYFGQELVVYRGKSGRIVMLDAYCPHMGTHLGRNDSSYVVKDGQIEGDSIRCPYHAWRFGADGRCDHIPYYDGPIPKAARIRSWLVQERAGIVFVWHDPEGQEPDYPLPDVPQWDDPAWVRWTPIDLGPIPAHPQEIVDNMADVAHLGPTHAAPVEYFEDEIRGHISIQRQGGRSQTLVDEGELLETDSWYYGPGFLISTMTGYMDSQMLIAHTPVDDGVTRVWFGLMVKSPHAVATAEDIAAGRSYQEDSRIAFVQDFEIWTNKKPAVQILQLPEDGPFHKIRAWYSQFYNPRARSADILRRAEGRYGAVSMPRPERRRGEEKLDRLTGRKAAE